MKIHAALCLMFFVGSCSEYQVAHGNKGPNATKANTTGGDGTTPTTDSGWVWTTGDDDDDVVGDDDDDTGTTSQGDDDDDFTTGTGTVPTIDTGTWDTGGWDVCDWALHVAGFLDAYNTPGDGKVVYCHQSGGPNYVMNDTSNAACLTHIAHLGDVFPTTICDS